MGKMILALLVLLTFGVPTSASAGSTVKRLGTDPAGDAAPALDLTFLDVGGHQRSLEIRIGIEGMTPGTGGIPALPGIEWIFDVGRRTFVAEAVANAGPPDFYLFELKDDSFQQLDSPEGTYDPADGYASILVPYEDIGARPGMKISGTGPKGTEDVDAHVHLGPQTYYADSFATKRDFVLP